MLFLKAMEFLHEKLKIVHRNLRGKNIFFIEEGDEVKAVVGDFGCSLHSLSQNDDFRTFDIGSRKWMVFFKMFTLFLTER